MYRTAQLQVQTKTLKYLRLVRRLYPARGDSERQSTADNIMTADELADKLLLDAIKTFYPRVVELVKAQDKLEKEAIEAGKHIVLDA